MEMDGMCFFPPRVWPLEKPTMEPTEPTASVCQAQYLVTGSDSTKGATSRGGGKQPVDGKEAMYM